jgi:hypothetical protein
VEAGPRHLRDRCRHRRRGEDRRNHARCPEDHGTSSPGRSSGLAIEVGANIATLGLDWLASYLKAKVDQTQSANQIAAWKTAVKNKINANPDEAVKKMMVDPDKTVYAGVYLSSSVIMGLGSDPYGNPTLNSSSPLIDQSRIEYWPMPVTQEIMNSFPTISGTGSHVTVTRSVVIDLALITPKLEDLINYAKARSLPLDDILQYVPGRYQGTLSTLISGLDTRKKILDTLQSTNDIFNKLHAAFEDAQKRKDVELQKSLSKSLVSLGNSMTSLSGQLTPIREGILKSDQKVKYWDGILALHVCVNVCCFVFFIIT